VFGAFLYVFRHGNCFRNVANGAAACSLLSGFCTPSVGFFQLLPLLLGLQRGCNGSASLRFI
jgi:hypothetical protein